MAPDSQSQSSDHRVLVTDAQLRSSLAVIRSLGQAGISVVAADESRISTGRFSKYAKAFTRYPSPTDTEADFISWLCEYCDKADIDLVMPVSTWTTKAISRHYEAVSSVTNVPIQNFERMEPAWDKGQTLSIAEEVGIPVPETKYPISKSEAMTSAEKLGFPLVIKPRRSSGSRGIRYVESMEELESAYDSVSKEYKNPLLQEKLPTDGQGLGVGLLFDSNNESKASFTYKRLREYPPSGGPSTLRESTEDSTTLSYAKSLLRKMDWEGIAMVEFKVDERDGEPKLMEVNPRFWGSLHLPLYAGVDFPQRLYEYGMGESVVRDTEYEVGVQCRFLLPADLLNLLSRRNRGALMEFFPVRDNDLYYDICSWDDPGPVCGRLLAMGRFSLSPEMWKKVIFR